MMLQLHTILEDLEHAKAYYLRLLEHAKDGMDTAIAEDSIAICDYKLFLLDRLIYAELHDRLPPVTCTDTPEIQAITDTPNDKATTDILRTS